MARSYGIYLQTPMHCFVYFMTTNVQSQMKTSHLESFRLVFSKKLVLFAENERPANKLKPTNRHQDMNYKTLNLIDLIKYPGCSLHRWTDIFTLQWNYHLQPSNWSRFETTNKHENLAFLREVLWMYYFQLINIHYSTLQVTNPLP